MDCVLLILWYEWGKQKFVLPFRPVFTGQTSRKNYFTWYVKIRAFGHNIKATQNDGTDIIFIIISGEIPELAYDNQAYMLR